MMHLRQVMKALDEAQTSSLKDLSDDELLRLHRDLSVLRILIEDDDRFKALRAATDSEPL